jgi:hypothetical protein
MSTKSHFTEHSRNGVAHGRLASKIFRGIEELNTSDLLAREVIQNSWDAARKLRVQLNQPKLPFQMRFRFVNFTGEEKKRIVEFLKLEEIYSQSKHMKKKSSEKVEIAYKKILDPKEPLKFLYCEDFGAHGLYGAIDKRSKSIMFKALYMFGDTDKGDDQGSGGSYGFGKSAFIQGSGIRTVLAYSSFEPFEGDPVTRRFVGFSYWDNFHIDDDYFDGRAIFGAQAKNPGSPFEDNEADTVAEALGFERRSSKKSEGLGTSLGLVAPSITPQELLSSLEKWWWPALVANQMEISVIDETGHEHFPRPQRNEFVRPFLKTYSIARGETKAIDAMGEVLVSQGWQKSHGIRLGEYALRRIDDEELVALEDEEANCPLVAVMRKPLMVVEYKSYKRSRIPIRGTFVASEDADGFLKLSEPAQHDHWDTKPVAEASDDENKAAAIAKSVDDQLKKGLAKFIEQISPPSPRDRQTLSMFADLLKGLLTGKKPGPKKPTGNSKMPFEIQFTRAVQPEEAAKNQVKTSATVQVSLSPNADADSYPVRVSFEFTIVEDEDDKGDSWPVDVRLVSKVPGFTTKVDGVYGELKKGAKVGFEVVSHPYDANWTGMLRPRVELQSVNKGEGN